MFSIKSGFHPIFLTENTVGRGSVKWSNLCTCNCWWWDLFTCLDKVEMTCGTEFALNLTYRHHGGTSTLEIVHS